MHVGVSLPQATSPRVVIQHRRHLDRPATCLYGSSGSWQPDLVALSHAVDAGSGECEVRKQVPDFAVLGIAFQMFPAWVHDALVAL